MKRIFEASALRPPARDDMVFDGGIKHPDIFIWDAWVYNKGPDIYLYTLASPRDIFKNGDVDIQLERDHIPHHHRLFISQDRGQSWRDQGPVFAPRLGENKFDSRSVWTGSTIDYQGKIVAGYTGIRPTDDQHPFVQNIGLSVSEDGGKSYKPLMDEALSDPLRDYDAIRATGYFLGARNDLGNMAGENGGCALAWRDPGLIVHPKTGQIHAFWSAKSDTFKPQEAVLAHGIIHDPLTAPRLELLAPVRLPDEALFTQAEVPQLIYNKTQDAFYLVLSTTDKTSELQTDAQIDTSVRLYMSKTLETGWAYTGHLITKQDKRYPAALISMDETPEGGSLHFMAPFNRSNGEERMHTMPPPSTAVVENGAVKQVLKPGIPSLETKAEPVKNRPPAL